MKSPAFRSIARSCLGMSVLIALSAALLPSSARADDRDVATFIQLPWRYVIGGYGKIGWMKSEEAGRHLTAEMTPFKVYDEKGNPAGEVMAGPAQPDTDICPDVWMCPISPAPDNEKSLIAVSAPWNVIPRKVRTTDLTQETYVEAVREVLVQRGIPKPTPKLSQLFRADLDGDGDEEVIISATRYTNKDEVGSPVAGDYSMLMMRRFGKGKVTTQVFSGEFYPKTDENTAYNVYQIAGIMDLNGDGTMEVIVRTTYYEGGGIEVWQLQQGVLTRVIVTECGV